MDDLTSHESGMGGSGSKNLMGNILEGKGEEDGVI